LRPADGSKAAYKAALPQAHRAKLMPTGLNSGPLGLTHDYRAKLMPTGLNSCLQG
ncbi:hypothetical protein, partial, partial [Absidia glauca]